MTSLLAAFLVAASAIATEAAAGDFMRLGFTHILPHGLDHVLFVLGLFFCCREFGTLLAQVTLFTLAHSLSLGLAVAGGWEAPAQIVEVLIVLSIVFVAAKNLVRGGEPDRWSWIVTFAFGLVHGLGFADVFRHSAASAQDFMVALLSFNVGVELGQLIVILAAFLCVGRFWEESWYRRVVVVPASSLIALAGLGWAILRIAE